MGWEQLVNAGIDFAKNNAGAIIGGIAGAAGNSGSSKTNETTATKDPWGPAQPYIMRNLQDQQALQDYYKANPFNAQQQAGINNTFADADHFRASVAPGLMDFANKGMTSSYSRQTGGAPGSGAGYGGAVKPGGLLSSGQGPFGVTPGQHFGLMDFAKANPFTNGAIPAPAPAAAAPAPTFDAGLLSMGGGGRGSDSGMSGGGDMSGGTWSGGMGVGKATDAINQRAMEVAKQFGLADPVVGVLAGLMSKGYSEWEAMQAINATEDPLGAWISAQGHDGGGSSGDGVGGYGGEGYGSGTDGSSGGHQSSFGSGSVGGW